MSVARTSVAIVDDDPALLRSLGNLFESAGYTALTFSSAETLLSIGFSAVDCLVADIGMPGLDGFELQQIASRLQPELPIFLITGRHEIADQERASARSIAGLFRKPFDGSALLDAVNVALREWRRSER